MAKKRLSQFRKDLPTDACDLAGELVRAVNRFITTHNISDEDLATASAWIAQTYEE